MPSNRCQSIVLDSESKRLRKCKMKFKWEINNLKYCTCHYNNILKKNIIKIQSLYRGYKIRRKIKYFSKLNCDLQRKIIKEIKYDYYTNIYHQSISNIIIKKIHNFIIKNLNDWSNYIYVSGGIQWYNINSETQYTNFYKIAYELFHIFYLLDKYYILIKNNPELYFLKYINLKYLNSLNNHSMYHKLYDLSNKIVYYSKPNLNLEGLSTIENFNKNLPSIIKFNENLKIFIF